MMKSNVEQKNIKSKKQEISDKRYKFGKNNIMYFKIVILSFFLYLDNYFIKYANKMYIS